MDSNEDDNIVNEEYIRPPDKVKRERLMDPYPWEEETEEDILQNMLDYEKEIQKFFNEEKNKRKESFKELLFKLKQLSKYDKEVEEIYYIIEPIIESYCEQVIQYYAVDKITYDRIFNVLSSIRTDKELLKKVILCY
jgi:hemoglobin-like flavoprotein